MKRLEQDLWSESHVKYIKVVSQNFKFYWNFRFIYVEEVTEETVQRRLSLPSDRSP